MKDLIRYLRHEDDTRDVRQQLGAGQIVQNDLLPIIIQQGQDKPLFDACIRYKPYNEISHLNLKCVLKIFIIWVCLIISLLMHHNMMLRSGLLIHTFEYCDTLLICLVLSIMSLNYR